MVSVCLPSDALLPHLPSFLGFSSLGRGVSLLGCSSKAQPLFLSFNQEYLLTATVPDLQRGIAPLGPPVLHSHHSSGCSSRLPALASGVGGSSQCRPWLQAQGGSSISPSLASGARWLYLAAPDLGRGVAPPGRRPDLGHRVSPPGRPRPRTRGRSSRPPPLTSDSGCLLPAPAADLGLGVAPLGCRP